MPTWVWIVIAIGAAIVIAAIARSAYKKRRSGRLQDTFGAEYDRTVADAPTRRERVAQTRRRCVDSDVVGRIVALRIPVGGHEQPPDRQHPHTRNDLVADRREPGGLERVDSAAAQRADSLVRRDRTLQKEDANNRRKRTVGQPPLVGRRLVRLRGLLERGLVDGVEGRPVGYGLGLDGLRLDGLRLGDELDSLGGLGRLWRDELLGELRRRLRRRRFQPIRAA